MATRDVNSQEIWILGPKMNFPGPIRVPTGVAKLAWGSLAPNELMYIKFLPGYSYIDVVATISDVLVFKCLFYIYLSVTACCKTAMQRLINNTNLHFLLLINNKHGDILKNIRGAFKKLIAWHRKNNVCKQKFLTQSPATDMHLVQHFSKVQIPVYKNSSSCFSSRPFTVHVTCSSSENVCLFSIISVLEINSRLVQIWRVCFASQQISCDVNPFKYEHWITACTSHFLRWCRLLTLEMQNVHTNGQGKSSPNIIYAVLMQ